MNIKKYFEPLFLWFYLLLIVQILVFFTHATKNLIDYYPTYFDQGAYLTHAYSLATEIDNLKNFFIKSINFLMTPSPQGPLFPLLGALSVKVFPFHSRLAALLVNLAFWILLNLFLFKDSLKNDNSYKLLALLFLSCMPYPFYMYGGLFDFRPDFSTFCLYGISTLLFLKYLNNPIKKNLYVSLTFWFLLFLNRQITFVYANVIFFNLSMIGLLSRKLFTGSFRFFTFKKICKHWFLYLLSCLPFLFISFLEIKKYYFVGHVTGVEGPLRAVENNVLNLKSYLLFYPKTLIYNHLGVGLSSLLFMFGFLALFFYKKRKINIFSSEKVYYFICFFIPIVVLTIVKNKSPIVGGIVLLPLFLLVASISCAVCNEKFFVKLYKYIFLIMVTAWPFMIFYSVNPLYQMPGQKKFQREESLLVQKLLKKINLSTSARYTSNFIFCGLGPYPFFFDKSLVAFNYEQNKTILNIVNPFQNYFQHTERVEFLNKLRSCDIVAYDELQKNDLYPINQDVFSMIPNLNLKLSSFFIKYESLDLDNKRFVFWTRKDNKLN